MPQPSAGHFCPVNWQPALPGGQLSVIDVRSHDLKISALLHDVTTTAALGVRARLAGPTDVDGSVQTVWDALKPPYLPVPNIIAGFSGNAAFFLSPVRSIAVPLIIGEVHFAAAVDKEVIWDFSAKCNSLAGPIIYPAL